MHSSIISPHGARSILARLEQFNHQMPGLAWCFRLWGKEDEFFCPGVEGVLNFELHFGAGIEES